MGSSGLAAGIALCFAGLLAGQTVLPQTPLTDREHMLLDRIEALEKRLDMLEGKPASPTSTPAEASAASVSPAISNTQSPAATRQGILGLPGATLNFYFDGYYGWNYNRPADRLNSLRANDTLSNNLTMNQVGLILERAPDVAAGRRYGGRVDLMFGQNTETLQGSPQNEPRPQVYRNVFQAYGTYVFPLGSGLTVDFGKFYSGLGFENNYAYDEVNYSRGFYFNYLPYYHMGVRSTYNINDKLSVQHWLVNGANQTEDFNGGKSNALLFTIKPSKTVSWNVNYYVGREEHDPARNGRTHIFDTYASWSPNAKLTAVGEFDYVVSRTVPTAAPAHVMGGAGYLQYHFTPKLSLSTRYEYLKDQGGLFSGATQALKENTLTFTYQFIEGFQMRVEQRRDFSNVPFFVTAAPGQLKKEQNTSTIGLIWWFGGKRESW